MKTTVATTTGFQAREGWLYCCCVMDAFSRKVVGWSIDSSPDTRLVLNALDMAIKTRDPAPGGVVHADHGAQFTSWAFGNRIRSAGLMPSFGSVGDGLDNAMIESFWSSMQIELLDRQRWREAPRVQWRAGSPRSGCTGVERTMVRRNCCPFMHQPRLR